MIFTMNRTLIIFLSMTLLSSCAYHSGVMTGNAFLSDSDFTIVDLAIGRAEITKVFGLGGISTDALVFEAKRNLYKNYPLSKGQALANVTVDYKKEFYLLYSKNVVIISAEVVDFNKKDSTSIIEDINTLHHNISKSKDIFYPGAKVYISDHDVYRQGEVMDIKHSKLIVQFFDIKNRLRTSNYSINSVFLYDRSNSEIAILGYKIGEDVKLKMTQEDSMGGSEIKINGTIEALGYKYALIEYNVGSKKAKIKVSYDQIDK